MRRPLNIWKLTIWPHTLLLCRSPCHVLWSPLLLQFLYEGCVLVALYYPNIEDVLRYTGAAGGSVYVWGLPPIVHMMVTRKQTGRWLWGRTLSINIFGAMILLFQFIPLPDTF